MDVPLLAVVLGAAAAFLVGGAWYAMFARQIEAWSPARGATQPGPVAFAVEGVRCLVVAVVVAGLVTAAEVTGVVSGLALAVALWAGFPVVLLAGSVLWERVPWRLAALHAGDWLVKLLVVVVIVTALR